MRGKQHEIRESEGGGRGEGWEGIEWEGEVGGKSLEEE